MIYLNSTHSVSGLGEGGRLFWLKPFGFIDYNWLQMSTLCVVSDSGTIAEKSSMLGFAAVTPILSIERPEAIMVCGTNPDAIIRCVDLAIGRKGSIKLSRVTVIVTVIPDVYGVENVSERVARLIIATAGLSNAWNGVRTTERAP